MTDTQAIEAAAKELRAAEDGLAFLDEISDPKREGDIPLWAEVDMQATARHLQGHAGYHVVNVVANKLREHLPEAVRVAKQDRINTINLLKSRLRELVDPGGRQP